jgi:hypothetical protein
MMIHITMNGVNTFFRKTFYQPSRSGHGRQLAGLSEQDRSIQQTGPRTRYENRELRCGILSGKVANVLTGDTTNRNHYRYAAGISFLFGSQ